jgi:hypothetical protein
MTTNVQHKGSFNINEHFTELMNGVGLDPSDTGGTITFVGEDPIMESRIRLGASYSIPYMGTAAAAAMIWKMRTGRGGHPLWGALCRRHVPGGRAARGRVERIETRNDRADQRAILRAQCQRTDRISVNDSGIAFGSWAVQITTRRGACDPSSTFGVEIHDGVVSGAAGGRVSKSGAVSVSVSSGGSYASGSGHLSTSSGGGSWHGVGSRGACSGTWVAGRR